jgi:hypothetical protein
MHHPQNGNSMYIIEAHGDTEILRILSGYDRDIDIYIYNYIYIADDDRVIVIAQRSLGDLRCPVAQLGSHQVLHRFPPSSGLLLHPLRLL